MPSPREKMARRTAQALLQQELKITKLPIDPFLVAEMKKPAILLMEKDLPPDIYGAFGKVDGRFVIAISRACPTPGHRKFTAGHELGHYHLDGHLEHMFASGAGWVQSKGAHFQLGADPIEREADFFASELLMPENLVRPLVRGRLGIAHVRRIADACEVSLSSAAITLARLAGDPLAVLVSKDGILEWPALSPSLLAYPWTKRPFKGEWAPPRSATKRLSRDASAVRRSEEAQAEGLMCEWFVDAPRDTQVTEEAVGLGSYGRVLTVLRPGGLPDPDEEQERAWSRQRAEWADQDN